MDTLDVVVLLLAVMAGIGGFRMGFVARAASWAGMALGIVLAVKLLPSLTSSEVDPQRLLLLGLVVVFAGAIAGQILGFVVGAQLRMVIPGGGAQSVDRAGGAAAGVVGVLVGYWLLLPIFAQTPQWPAQQARNSAIASFIHDYFPEAPDTTQALRRVLGPRVFEGFGPAPSIGAPPAASGLSQETAKQVARLDRQGRGARVLAGARGEWVGRRSGSDHDQRPRRGGRQGRECDPRRRRATRCDGRRVRPRSGCRGPARARHLASGAPDGRWPLRLRRDWRRVRASVRRRPDLEPVRGRGNGRRTRLRHL